MRTLLLLSVPFALALAGSGLAAEPPAQRQAALVAPGEALHPAEALDIGALTLESDFTVFMRRDCPEPVRRRGLRKLWSLLPHEAVPGPTTF